MQELTLKEQVSGQVDRALDSILNDQGFKFHVPVM